MRLCLAQVKPFKGDISRNLELHEDLIMRAAAKGADLITFPELSLTGYEPELAKELATRADDIRFASIQKISDREEISIGLGVPIKGENGIFISMLIFQPRQDSITYSKQYLHTDELPYFIPGTRQTILTIKGKKIAPAICYESLLPEHAAEASKLGASIYLASVAKPKEGVAKALEYFPKVAKMYSMPVAMVNCTGYCDNFEAAGTTSVWDQNGELKGQLDENEESLLFFDT